MEKVERLTKYISNSKKGFNREINQDRNYKFIKREFNIFTVFDGVSSLPKSFEFIDWFIRGFERKITEFDNVGDNLGKILYETNAEIWDRNINGKSTISLLFLDRKMNRHKFLSIGDSRIYIFSNQFIEQITQDDTLFTNSNIITRCLGDKLSLNDFELREIKDMDNFLICSDGFHNLMHENLKEYFTVFNSNNLNYIKKKISYLQRGKNQDDSSYILIKHEV